MLEYGRPEAGNIIIGIITMITSITIITIITIISNTHKQY